MAVVQFLFAREASEVFARALVYNYISVGLLTNAGFARLKEPYADPDDGLRWQNFVSRTRSGRPCARRSPNQARRSRAGNWARRALRTAAPRADRRPALITERNPFPAQRTTGAADLA
jgi:hypothetical protein